jgi:hypothetical protein
VPQGGSRQFQDGRSGYVCAVNASGARHDALIVDSCGKLDQIMGDVSWNPSELVTLSVSGERDLGRLKEGSFTEDLIGTKVKLNLSSDLQLNAFLQYDSTARSFGTNTRLRWIFT